ncbi:MAG TPA: DUF4199 domain-containing protein [Membranihabitans sp.]|nr:DUF4199 domain-containing protein [Membranihabitans sp.]
MNLGLLAGGAIVVILLVVDLINNRLLVHFTMSYFPTLLLIAAMLLAVREARKDYDHLSFADAFKESMIPFLIGNGIYLLFNYFLYNYIDPSLGEIAREKALELVNNDMFSNLFDEAQLEEMVDQISEMEYRPTIMQMVFSYMFSLILPGAVISLILAAIFRTRTR